MAERSIYIDAFHDLTESASNVETGSVLWPQLVFSGQYDINAGFSYTIYNAVDVLSWRIMSRPISKANAWLEFFTDLPEDAGYRAVLYGYYNIQEADFNSMIEVPLQKKTRITFDGDDYKEQVMRNAAEMHLQILTADRRPVRKSASHIYQSTNWPQSFSWQSKPILLGSFAYAVSKVTVRLTDGTVHIASLDWSKVNKSSYTPPSTLFSPWKLELEFSSDQQKWDTFTRLPLPSEFAAAGYKWVRLKLYGDNVASGTPTVGVDEVVLTLAEEYAQEAPGSTSRITRSNLYVPRLQVYVNGVDIARNVARASTTEVAVLDNAPWVREQLVPGASVSVYLDGQLLATGVLGEMRRESYLNGDLVSFSILRPIDMLGRSEDVEVVTQPDGVTGQLPFADDLGYIAHLVDAVVPGAKVLTDDRTGWRPTWVWKQRPASGEHRFVQLDSDFDWLQLYAVNNTSILEKVQKVAEANGFLATSFAGNLYLTPIAPYPTEPLTKLKDRARILHMTSDGRFFPEVRFGVPELVYSDQVPREFSLVGLSDAVPDDLPKLPAVFKRTDGTYTGELHISGFYPRVQADTFVRINNIYYRAVFKSLKVEITHVEGIDLNPFAENRPYYKFIYGTISGYYGIIGIEFWMAGSVFEYDDYFLKAEGELLYYDAGSRNDNPVWKATGRYAPAWAQFPDGTNLVGEWLTIGTRLNGVKESIENPFVPKYDLPNGAHEYTLGNYTLYRDYGDRLVDMLATRKAAERVVAIMPVVGPAGFKVNDIVGIARLPEDGIGGVVREIDLYLVLEEPEVQVEAGGQVRSTVRMGYLGTLKDGQPVYDDRNVSWRSLTADSNDWYL